MTSDTNNPIYSSEECHGLQCPNLDCTNDNDGDRMYHGCEGFTCSTCFNIWNECDHCTKLVDKDFYKHIVLKCKSPEKAEQIVWMKLTGWWRPSDVDLGDDDSNDDGEEDEVDDDDRPFNPPPHIARVDKHGEKFTDDQTIFRWSCEKCGKHEITRCC